MEDPRQDSRQRLLDAAAAKDVVGPAAVAKALNVSDQVMNNWKTRGVAHAKATLAQQMWGVSASWIATGEGDQWVSVAAMPSSPPAPDTPRKQADAPTVVRALEDDFVAVRRADVRFANGVGQIYYEADDKPPLVFRLDFLRRLGIKTGRAVVVDSRGISNEPKIRDRSVVLVNEGDREHLDGDFFAFRYDGELLIKRLERVDGVGILATAENSNFRPKQKLYTDLTDFEVIGRCVWEGAEL